MTSAVNAGVSAKEAAKIIPENAFGIKFVSSKMVDGLMHVTVEGADMAKMLRPEVKRIVYEARIPLGLAGAGIEVVNSPYPVTETGERITGHLKGPSKRFFMVFGLRLGLG